MPQTHSAEKTTAATGCFGELSPSEFNHRKDMTVILHRHPHAVGEFTGFRQVLSVQDCQDVEQMCRGLPSPLGLVCENGQTSARMAIRLSQKGFTVYHLAGGLGEWRVYHQVVKA